MDAAEVYTGEVGVGDTEDVSISICSTELRRVRVAPKVNQRKSKTASCPLHLKYYKRASLSTTSDDQELIPSSIPSHAIFILILDPLLLAVLQVQYQNKQQSPFETHPVQMQTFLTAICIYSAVLGIKVHKRTRSGCQAQMQILTNVLLLSGALSSASLLSILLQPLLFWVLLIIGGSIPIIMARHLLKSSLCRILVMVARLTWDVRNCKLATMFSIFHRESEASASGSSDAHPTNRVGDI